LSPGTGKVTPLAENRWAKAGIIPKSQIGSILRVEGRSPTGLTQFWTVVGELLNYNVQGHTLSSALASIEHEHFLANLNEVTSPESTSRKVGKILSDKKIELSSG
jgi:hypothetical protein